MVKLALLASVLLPLAQALQRNPLPISKLRDQIQTTTFSESLYPEYFIDTPIDHFHNDSMYEPHSNGTFKLRYWFDAQYYKPGGPVFVLAGGETDGADRLPFLQKGIVAQVSKATNGLGVILEHRYYGSSIPTPDFSTKNLRFLTTDQALADTAYFAKNIKFPGLPDDWDMTSAKNAYIAYGGSYAGAFVAFLRKLYPDVYWGAISSSGVTVAVHDFWEYFTAATTFGPPACIQTTQKLTNVVDNILTGNKPYIEKLKGVFGLSDVKESADFASAINGGIYGLQSYNWDPSISENTFWEYCDTVSNETVIDDSTEPLRGAVKELIEAGGWGFEGESLVNRMLNYIGYVRRTSVAGCKSTNKDDCFSTSNKSFYQQDDTSQTWRLWPYQFCTQWGYLQTGNTPVGQMPLISRTINLEYSSTICREAFGITTPPDVEAINKHGGYNISYERLAIVDGEWDPWRAATPNALHVPKRPDTDDEPFKLIAQAVHHWDENGVFPNETRPGFPPSAVALVQTLEAEFVHAWAREYQEA